MMHPAAPSAPQCNPYFGASALPSAAQASSADVLAAQTATLAQLDAMLPDAFNTKRKRTVRRSSHKVGRQRVLPAVDAELAT